MRRRNDPLVATLVATMTILASAGLASVWPPLCLLIPLFWGWYWWSAA